MMASFDGQFEIDEGYENYDDDEQMEYLNIRGVQGWHLLYSARNLKDKIHPTASETLFECSRSKSSL